MKGKPESPGSHRLLDLGAGGGGGEGPLPRGHFQPITETVKSEDSSVLTLSIRRLEIDSRAVGGTRHQLMYNTGTEAGSEDRTCGI